MVDVKLSTNEKISGAFQTDYYGNSLGYVVMKVAELKICRSRRKCRELAIVMIFN